MISVLQVGPKIVTIQGFEDGVMKMCAIEYPNDIKSEHVVHISERYKEGVKQMAFHFLRGEDYYYPAVVGKSLTLEMAGGEINVDMIPNKGWFLTKYHVGDNYSLQSVAEPSIYLQVEKKRPYAFTVVDGPEASVQVTTRKI